MPCGGILPTHLSITHDYASAENRCMICGKNSAGHFVEEWDDYIHALCAVQALADENNQEMQIIIKHGHEVMLDFSLMEKGDS